MKLRYYMRGLGIGIIVTAIVLSISLRDKGKPMTDEQVVERAKELGMEEKYDSTVLSETVSANETSKEEPGQMAAADEPAGNEMKADDANASDVSADQANDDKSKAEKTTENETKPDEEKGNVTETSENKQAQEALDRAEQAKEEAKESASRTVKETEGLADDAAQLKVDNPSKPESTKTDDHTSDAGEKSDAEKNDTARDDKGNNNLTKQNADKEETKNPDEGKTDETKSKGSADDKQSTTNSQSQVTITVSGGDGSFEVAKKLQAAGVIEDSKAYDDYLCQNGYDRRITTGKHVIKPNATQEEIAKELTTKVK